MRFGEGSEWQYHGNAWGPRRGPTQRTRERADPAIRQLVEPARGDEALRDPARGGVALCRVVLRRDLDGLRRAPDALHHGEPGSPRVRDEHPCDAVGNGAEARPRARQLLAVPVLADAIAKVRSNGLPARANRDRAVEELAFRRCGQHECAAPTAVREDPLGRHRHVAQENVARDRS